MGILKHRIFVICLKILRRLSKVRQVGNPSYKAPVVKNEPALNGDVGEIEISILKNSLASALYGGAIINELNEVSTKFVSFPWGKSLHPIFSYPYIGKKKGILKKAIYLITPEAKGNYYHWMIDLLPRLLLIKKRNLSDFKERVLILHFPSKSYELDTLDMLNISVNNVVRLRPFEIVEAEDLVVLEHYSNEKKFPNWKRIVLNEFKELSIASIPEKVCNKIYLYRGHQKIRRLINEERLVSILREKGFQIVDPQKLRLAEQIAVLKEARIIVSMHGAALTNIVFCEEGSTVIELRSTNKPPDYYSSIAKTCNLNFETISIAPVRIQKKRHHANKENLILTENSIELLLSKISASETLLLSC